VIGELRTLADVGCTRINFTDENFVPARGGKGRALQFVELLKRSGLRMEFLTSVRVQSVDVDVFGQLRSAGLCKVFLGVESGVDRLLRLYRKGFTASEALSAIRQLRGLDIAVFAGTILFDPVSTFDEVVASYDYFRSMERLLGHFDIFRYSRRLQAYSGTEIRDRFIKDGLMEPDPLCCDCLIADERVRSLYDEIVAVQGALYPHYAQLGRYWECRPEDPRMKELVWAFASVFHNLVAAAIDRLSVSPHCAGRTATRLDSEIDCVRGLTRAAEEYCRGA
jgi:hypothetical protein